MLHKKRKLELVLKRTKSLPLFGVMVSIDKFAWKPIKKKPCFLIICLYMYLNIISTLQPWTLSWTHCSCFVFVRMGTGLQACAGDPERRGLWRRWVALWKLHLPQPPCTQPLRDVRDATPQLNGALCCLASPCPHSLDTMSHNLSDHPPPPFVNQYTSSFYLLRKSHYPHLPLITSVIDCCALWFFFDFFDRW